MQNAVICDRCQKVMTFDSPERVELKMTSMGTIPAEDYYQDLCMDCVSDLYKWMLKEEKKEKEEKEEKKHP